MLAAIVRWSLERPRLIAGLAALFLVWGVAYVRDLRFELLPNLAPAETTILTESPGLSAEQVEDLVTRPIENGLVGARDVGQIRSKSIQGLSVITVRLADGADPYRARQFLTESLATISGLPPNASSPKIAPLTSQNANVLMIGLVSDRLDLLTLRDLAQWTIRPRLLAAQGVAQVSLHGGQVRRLEVRARPADLSDSDLGFLDVLNAVRRSTSVAGAGFIDTPNQRVLIEPHGQALTADNVNAGQIQTPGAAPVRIGDVADVSEAAAPALGDALINGKPGVLLTISRQFGADPLDTTHAAETAFAALKPLLDAQGVTAVADLDRPIDFATLAIQGVAIDLMIGALLIAVALSIFLRDGRAVLICLFSLPLSLIVGLIVVRLFGWRLNAMILGGLIVSLGVVIDDTVIGVENVIARLRTADHTHASDLQTILEASLDVRGPITHAVLVLVLALAPLIALPGLQGALLGPLAVTVIAASLASLVAATLVTPALCLLFHRHDGPPPEPKPLIAFKAWHAKALPGLLARPRPALSVAAVGVVGAVVALSFFRPELLPSVHDGHVVAEIDAPVATSLDVMRESGGHLSLALSRIEGVRSVAQSIGRDTTSLDSFGPEHARFDIDLKPGLSAGAQDAIAKKIQDELARHPGLKAQVRSRFDAERQSDRFTAPVEIRLFGQDLDTLNDFAGQIAGRLRKLPGAGRVETDPAAKAPSMRIDLDFDRLALFGLSTADVLDTVQTAFAGVRASQFYQDGRAVDLVVDGPEQIRRDPESVGELLLRSSSGISTPLNSVAKVYLTDGQAAIAHEGGLRRQLISAYPADSRRFLAETKTLIAHGVKPPGGAFLELGGADTTAKSAQLALLINYAVVLALIAALLVAAFDGRTGLLILGSTVFWFVGAAVAVAGLGGVLSAGALAGLVALFGIALRSAILLFDQLQDQMEDQAGQVRSQQIVRALQQRITPMLITTSLVMLGLAPLAIDAGQAGREILGPMAIVIICGLLTGILANLFVAPILLQFSPAKTNSAPHTPHHHH